MPKRLDDLYLDFFIPLELLGLKFSVEKNHKTLIEHLSKEDRKNVLQIIDALQMISNYQSKASFIQGFKLDFELTTELQSYDSHSAEIDSQSCGNFFMPQEVQEDEKEGSLSMVGALFLESRSFTDIRAILTFGSMIFVLGMLNKPLC